MIAKGSTWPWGRSLIGRCGRRSFDTGLLLAGTPNLSERITALENEQYVVGNEVRKCTRRLEEANGLQRIMDQEVSISRGATIIPWVFERGRSA